MNLSQRPWSYLVLVAALVSGSPSAPPAASEIQIAYRTVGVSESRDLTSEFAWTEALAEIQSALFELGFYDGPIDGRLTRATQDAIERYRRRHGVIDGDTTWPAMLVHIRAIGEATRLQVSLKEARQRQIEQAEERLLRHEGARTLIVRRIVRETADPTHDPKICFAAPTMRCLLDEALEDTRAVSREKYRNWALQDLIGAFARAGMLEPVKDAVRRLTDARLVLVSLRDAAAAMASSGRFSQAEETISLLPAGRDRFRALTVLAGQRLAHGDRGAAAEVVGRLITEIRNLEGTEQRIQAAAEATASLAREGAPELARRLSDADGNLPAPKSEPARSAIATAYAALDEPRRAETEIQAISDAAHRRPALIALVAAYARAGAVEEAIETSSRIDEARYRVVALCDAVRVFGRDGLRVEAESAVEAAVDHLTDVEGEFATDFAWSCLAESHAILGHAEKAEGAAREIKGVDLKARTLWRIAGLLRGGGNADSVQRFEDAAKVATEGVDTFKRVSVLSDVAANFAANGRMVEGRALLGQAIRIVGEIRTRWWRARALCRVAIAMIALESSPDRIE